MRPQINRLPDGSARGFSGAAIDRNRPLKFRIDGRVISGFSGDTVLSSALASGIDTLGLREGSPVGLTPRAAPAIVPAAFGSDPRHAMPMERVPAVDGAEYRTLGGKRVSPLSRLFQAGRTLGLPLDDAHALDRPWRKRSSEPGPCADLLVIGGGVAGMAAALSGARAGLSVILAEASPQLGGHSGLFGTQEGEDSPEDSMNRLRAEVLASEGISVLTAGEVFALRPGMARLHRVVQDGPNTQGHVLDIAAPRIVIATGSLERLPIFAGNRLPGVIGTLEAFELAVRYGVWPGQSALVATTSNPAYRLGMLASDAGLSIARIFDTRAHPASRFIEFSRAYGMVQSPGTLPEAVGIARAGGTLSVHLNRRDTQALVTERLLVSGGWQPDLTLWHVAGGASQWNADRGRLEARGDRDGIALAGSAAGYLTRKGCIQSGADAVDLLMGRPRRAVDDPVIDPLYESPDGPIAIAAARPRTAPAFLDAGTGLLQRPAPSPRRWRLPFTTEPPSGLLVLAEAAQPLAVCDVAAGVALELIPEAAAGIVAQERVALVPLAPVSDELAGRSTESAPLDHVPPYLNGRFGRDAILVRLDTSEERMFESGALIYPGPDDDQPSRSIGVVLRQVEGETLALVSAAAAQAGRSVCVRDKGTIAAIVRVRDS